MTPSSTDSVKHEVGPLTEAYAEGRGDQYEDDCEVVRLLFENLDDVDVMGSGFINTTRVRELLAHFDLPRSVECSGFECTRTECDSMGCLAARINTERDAAIAKTTGASPLEAQLITAVDAIDDGHDAFCMLVLRGKECSCGRAKATRSTT